MRKQCFYFILKSNVSFRKVGKININIFSNTQVSSSLNFLVKTFKDRLANDNKGVCT